MNRLPLIVCFLSLAAGAQEVGTPAAPPPSAAPEDPCLALEEEPDSDTEEVLGALRLGIGGQFRAFSGVELEGLERLSEEQVRTLARLPAASPLSPEQAATLLQRLARSGLFAQVTPTVRLAESEAPKLVLTLEEQPYLTAVEVEGLQEEELRELRAALFRLPPRVDSEEEGQRTTLRLEVEDMRVELVTRTCPPPWPPRGVLAHFEKQEFHPGFVWRGLPAALERGLGELRDEGYVLARLDATLTAEGKLVLRVEEGTVEAVEVRGVEEAVAAQVREVLGIAPGEVLLRSDLRRAARRVEAELPFLALSDVETLPPPETRFMEERVEGGARHYQPVVEPSRRKGRKRRHHEGKPSWKEQVRQWANASGGQSITTEERRVVVHVRPRGPVFDMDFLPMHTQVTGFAPGVETTLKLWDVGNRAHVTLDAALLVPLRWGGQRLAGAPDQTARQRRLNWLVGAKLQVPALRLAEVGAQLYDFTDTFDRWRMGALDSYLYSALLNRPDSEYFRRSGYTAFATWRFGPRWLTGVAYRRDVYESMESFTPPLSLFRPDSAPFPNSRVDGGRMASVVGRLEYASDAPRAKDVGTLFRSPEVSLLQHDWEWPERTALRSLLTVEVGNPALGGDAWFRFWKVVSDSALYVRTGDDHGLRLRLRVAGGEGLPPQKREALGGWSALRGYGFKEFRGDTSLLASAEYRWGLLGAFLDVGSVHRGEAGWMDPRLGVGTMLYFGDSVRFALAWRADERATPMPEARLFFIRPF
ncbi:MAG TPA: hypothetical protein VLQ93_14885 [Myxococcaceae bacterium]|nr:hypothetical protein [Myxococcaceae bacterium]